MSFQVQSKSAPAPDSQAQPTQSKTARAIAAFNAAGQVQQAPVSNPSQVSPEEMTALNSITNESEDESRQKDTAEAESDEAVKAADAPKEAKAEEPLSTQFAILARKEKALRAKAQEFRTQQDSFKAQQAAFEAEKGQLQSRSEESFKQRLAKDPIGALAEVGLSPEEVANLMLNPSKVDPGVQRVMERMEAEIKALKDAQENSKKASADQQSNAYKQAVSQIRLEAKKLVSADDSFETVRETGSVDDVVDLIERTFKEDGVLLDVEEAARQVEEYLIEEAMKIAKIKKIQQRLSPASKTDPKAPGAAPQQQQMKTLTNNISTSRQLSARERAMLAFKGEIKK